MPNPMPPAFKQALAKALMQRLAMLMAEEPVLPPPGQPPEFIRPPQRPFPGRPSIPPRVPPSGSPVIPPGFSQSFEPPSWLPSWPPPSAADWARMPGFYDEAPGARMF